MRKIIPILMLIVLASLTAFSQAKTEKLTGQVVCSLCWFEEEDRNKSPYGNAAAIECADECAEKGKGQSVAVKNEKGEFTLYELEKGAFAMKAKNFLEFVPKTVEVEGIVRESKGKKFIKVNTLKVVKAVEMPNLEPVDAKLALNDLSGIPQDLKSYNGRFAVVNFWATWCKPCVKELPAFDSLEKENKYLVKVILVSLDFILFISNIKVISFTQANL